MKNLCIRIFYLRQVPSIYFRRFSASIFALNMLFSKSLVFDFTVSARRARSFA